MENIPAKEVNDMNIDGIHMEKGKITKYRLDNGKVVTKQRCIGMIEKGKIENYHVGASRTGEICIIANRKKKNEKKVIPLRELPTF